MNAGWIVFGVIVLFMLGATLPLLRKDSAHKMPLPSAKETLRDWRKDS